MNTMSTSASTAVSRHSTMNAEGTPGRQPLRTLILSAPNTSTSQAFKMLTQSVTPIWDARLPKEMLPPLGDRGGGSGWA